MKPIIDFFKKPLLLIAGAIILFFISYYISLDTTTGLFFFITFIISIILFVSGFSALSKAFSSYSNYKESLIGTEKSNKYENMMLNKYGIPQMKIEWESNM